MDCMAAKALKKSSFLYDFGGKSFSQQQQQQQQELGGFGDDVWGVASAGGGGLLLNNVPCDDFSVDDLLDFSDKDFKDGPLKEEGEEDEDEEKEDSLSDDSSSSSHHRSSNFSSFSETDDFGLLLAEQLTAPADNLENLEWLSQLLDDSQSELSLLCPVGSVKDMNRSFSFSSSGWWSQPAAVSMIRVPCFSSPVPVKARSKRSRPNGKAWSGSPSLTCTTTTESSSTTTSSSSYGASALSPFAAAFSNTFQDLDLFSSGEKPPAKKQKTKKPSSAADAVDDAGSGTSGPPVTSRRCTHCQVQKTPQWRAGPLGPKTLCNACGVRYKSGRLFPEYRPACSPTFSQEFHSNSHRKVIEMRRKKEEMVTGDFSAMVPSF